MTKTDWAAILSGLPDEELTAALLALSDEDWLGEEAADLLRTLAQREGGLRPFEGTGSAGFFWALEGEDYSPLYDNLPSVLMAKARHDGKAALAVNFNTAAEAWSC